MKAAIIVLNWNSWGLIDVCLRGLRKHEPHSVYVVDNGSEDGSAERIAAAHSWVTLIRVPVNLGFAAGNNFGIARAVRDGCEVVVLLNNDTIVDEPFVDGCLAVLAQEPAIGIIGPVVVEGDTPTAIQCRGGRIISWRLAFPYIGRGEPYQRLERREIVDYVLGAAMIIRTEVVTALVGLDPEYFPAYVEEADFCFRARKAGFKSAVYLGARVRHLGDRSSGGYDMALRRYTGNRLRFGLKHLGFFTLVMAGSATVIGFCVRRWLRNIPPVKRLLWGRDC
jgi:GT2 family glycosyltransferase